MRRALHAAAAVLLAAPLSAQQVTLGALILACREPAKAFSELTPQAFGELRDVVRSAEAALQGFVRYQKINYLMLMMVDPDVHFHVFPRYEGTRQFAAAMPRAGAPPVNAVVMIAANTRPGTLSAR